MSGKLYVFVAVAVINVAAVAVISITAVAAVNVDAVAVTMLMQ